ncbi:hypothetical protein IW146_002133 [Coemansia sp. RSA 922]|nr:hypothetical protein H4S03_001738 [Coemansia sp. S3946]KAJ2065424.1 hypothetical protein GGI08_002224 [Coemansia sp. S2]KAJ2115659.1 hypothetical protein IW146_002133 [Coemansia sp. RSA 922]
MLRMVYKHPYIVLLDEYDKPLKAIRGQPWEKAAAEMYTSLFNKVFKDNTDLKCGLLVGVYKLPLVDIGSGANCVHFLPLTVHGYHSGLNDDSGQPAVLPNSLVDISEEIMTTLTKWYDGYAFGGTGGKFNPYTVAMFLRELEHGNINFAVQDYWRLTGNQYMIEELVSDNWAEFTRLISRLTWDYDNDDKSKCSVFLTGQQKQTGAPSTRDDAVGVLLGDESLPRNGGSRYTTSHIVTLLIHTGYLTIGTGGAVRIPNGELRNMWEILRLMVSFETDDNERQNNERTRLFSELYAGDVRGIFDSFQNAYNRLSNDSNTYKEKVLADIVRTHVIGKLDPPRLLQTDGTISSSDHLNRPDYTMEAESGRGKPDWVVKLPPTKENPQPFVIIFEFKRVTSAKNDNANGPLCLARTGLEQIFEREYARSLGEYTRQLDIGVAIGMGKVTMRQRLWSKVENSPVATLVRQRDDKELLKDSSEKVDEWDLRVVSADDAGWRDGMGWQTQSLDPSYRL